MKRMMPFRNLLYIISIYLIDKLTAKIIKKRDRISRTTIVCMEGN